MKVLLPEEVTTSKSAEQMKTRFYYKNWIMDIVFSNVEATGNLRVIQFEEMKIQCTLQK